MAHFHVPKPLHGWRAFFGEVGIIVVGVLIALSAEQIVQSVRERQVAAQARENVRAEAAQDMKFIRGRLAVQDCIERRLDELAELLSEAGGGAMKRQPTWISRPPVSPFFTRRWEAATASGRNSLFPAKEQELYGNLYEIFGRFSDYEAREQQVWSNLRALETWRGPLGPEARLSFAKDLQQARYLAWDLNVGARIADRDALGTLPVEGNPDKSAMAICLPIFTPRTQAVSRLRSRYGEP